MPFNFQCEDIEGKRYLHPEDLIYAQPVHIKPVGRPIPAVPLKGAGIGGVGYGPPRPVQIPGKYPGPYRPGSYGPPLRPPPPDVIYGGGPKPSIYEPDITGPYNPAVIDKKPVVVVNNPNTNAGGLQQHLHHHHHYVHGETGIKNPVVSGIVGPTAGFETPSYPPLGPNYGVPGISPVYGNTLTAPGYPLHKKQLNLYGGSSYTSTYSCYFGSIILI